MKKTKAERRGRILFNLGAAATVFGILCVDGRVAVGLTCTIGGMLAMLAGAAIEAGDS